MLVLSRRLHERIHVGEDLIITVVDLERGKVRIGIEAPNHVKVYREELLDPQQARKHLENARANGKEAVPVCPTEQRPTPTTGDGVGGAATG